MSTSTAKHSQVSQAYAAMPWALVLMTAATGCPVDAKSNGLPSPTQTKQPVLTEADPRVERKGEDLYPAKTLERAEALKRKPDPDAPAAGDDGSGAANPSGLGSGRADETNGKCRLYAPKLPNPECCEADLGFDAELVKEACGLDVYLGESFQGSCGYYFLNNNNTSVYFRLSQVAEPDVASAVRTHYRQPAMKQAPPAGSLGVEGVAWSRFRGFNWAYMSGWDGAVRLLSWRDGTCTEEGLKKIAEKLVAAKKPPKGTKRSLVPKAQY